MKNPKRQTTIINDKNENAIKRSRVFKGKWLENNKKKLREKMEQKYKGMVNKIDSVVVVEQFVELFLRNKKIFTQSSILLLMYIYQKK